jgi:ABC-type lipoprotein release transport system permease subunit
LAPDDSVNHDVLVQWATGVDEAAATRRLTATVDSEVSGARLPSELGNLERVRALPWAVAVLLAIVAVLAIVHAVVSTLRRRRRDLAVLRTLGLVDRQLSAVMRWEAWTFAAVGVVFGLPMGLVAGRFLWDAVASEIGVDPTASFPVTELLVIVVLAFVVALVASAVPAHYARRVHPARVLAVDD